MKTAIITGAATGMGFEEAKAVAAKGFHVIMTCHHPGEAEERRQQIIRETAGGQVEVMGIELADLSDVRRFADEVKARIGHLDLLMNNAGTLETHFHTTADGLEHTVSVNYVGPYLLTRLLLPLMGEGSRIVNMVSLTYRMGRLDFPDFFTRGRKGSFWRIPVYSNTKLALTLFTFHLADLLRDKGITVLVVEHNMQILDILDSVTVISFGEKIFEGTPEGMRNDPTVISTYFGGAV